MGKLKKKITKAAKKGIARQIGKQIKKLIEKNVDTADSRALNYTQKYAENLALHVMGEKGAGKGKVLSGTSPEISTKRDKKFKIKIKGMNKVVKDILNGKDVGKAIKDNAGFFVSFKFEW